MGLGYSENIMAHFGIKMWKLWAKALGEKAYPCSKDSDKVALIRTFIVLVYIMTNFFIVAGIIHHW